MPWYRVEDNQHRSWEVNSDGIARIVRSYIYQKQLLARSRRVVHSSGSWFLPDTVAYETNFSGLVGYVDTESARWVREAWVQANLNGEGLFNSLLSLRIQGVQDGETYHRNSMAASSESQQNINHVVDRDQAIVTGLTHVRNTSASVLIAGATVVSGGTATALVAAAGGGLRFTSRIQEGGSIGQAATETAIDLFVASITRGAGRGLDASASAMAVLGVVLNTGADLAKTGVTGEVGRNPAQGLVARLGAETVNGLVGVLLARGIPLIRAVPASQLTEVRDAIASAAFGFVGDRVVDAARGVNPLPSSSQVPANTLLPASPGLAQAETFVRETAMRRV